LTASHSSSRTRQTEPAIRHLLAGLCHPDGSTGDAVILPSEVLREVLSRVLHRRSFLLFASAFAVMTDPVSSVAYAIEAALRALHGDLGLLLPTMALVVGIITNYHQVVARFPEGGGAAAAAGRAFGEG
jgi:hypothetical protein